MKNKEKVKGFLLENFLFTDDPTELDDEESLLEKGVIDSTGVLEVIMFLEESFDIDIADKEMVRDNLDSVNRISDFLNSKLGPESITLGG